VPGHPTHTPLAIAPMPEPLFSCIDSVQCMHVTKFTTASFASKQSIAVAGEGSLHFSRTSNSSGSLRSSRLDASPRQTGGGGGINSSSAESSDDDDALDELMVDDEATTMIERRRERHQRRHPTAVEFTKSFTTGGLEGTYELHPRFAGY